MQTVQIVEGIVGVIQKRIEEYETLATNLVPPGKSVNDVSADIKNAYEGVSAIAEGLQEAIDIVVRGEWIDEPPTD